MRFDFGPCINCGYRHCGDQNSTSAPTLEDLFALAYVSRTAMNGRDDRDTLAVEAYSFASIAVEERAYRQKMKDAYPGVADGE